MRDAGPATDLACAGVTPFRVFDTSGKQSTSTSHGAGICGAMTCDWIAKNLHGGRVTELGQLSSAHAIGIAQSAHEIGHITERPDLFERYGLSLESEGSIGSKWYRKRSAKLKDAAAIVGWGGWWYISLRGRGGHAVGAHFQGQRREFFDPNEGLLTFGAPNDFARWFPNYVMRDYPDLTDECILFKLA